MLTTSINNVTEWPNVLWKVQQTLNTTVQNATGFSLTRLLIGREGNIPPIQARLDEVVDESLQPIINLESDRELARQRLRDSAERYK